MEMVMLHKTWRSESLLIGLSALLASVALGQPADESTSQASREEGKPESAASTVGQEDEPPAATSDLSSDELLESFQRERPQAMPVQPRPNAGEVVKRWEPGQSRASGAATPRMPDGYYLRDRTGRAVRDGEWWVFHFISDNHPDRMPDPPMKLLPNQLLERLVRETQAGAVNYEFIVSGEVTDFLGENYLLLRKLMRKRDLGNLRR
jgi:hypothetical protein